MCVKSITVRLRFSHKMETRFRDKIGKPDAVILLTDVVSHKLVLAAKKEADKKNITVIRSHKSTVNSLETVIQQIASN